MIEAWSLYYFSIANPYASTFISFPDINFLLVKSSTTSLLIRYSGISTIFSVPELFMIIVTLSFRKIISPVSELLSSHSILPDLNSGFSFLCI